MRLRKIKMAGFKSFVEPTTILFPSEMVGIVGPNGCGKSNIVDAVRWVMGESSRHLRGATMDDVIFNGSSSRKPLDWPPSNWCLKTAKGERVVNMPAITRSQ